MKPLLRNNLLLCAALCATTGSAVAAVSAEEAKQLGTTLTPWGAEKAGNKDGTIPAFTGEKIKVPASYDPKYPGNLPEPWGDKPLYTITAQNMSQYADKLTEGRKAMFKTYPNYRMDVYPSRRTAQFPDYVINNTLKNATSCKATGNGYVLEGCHGGIPFPIPKNGNEATWNHLLRYNLFSWTLVSKSIIVDKAGVPQNQGDTVTTQQSDVFDPNQKGVMAGNTIYWKFRTDWSGPPRRAGEKIVLIDPVDLVNVGRRAWAYIPGQRRVKLAPDLAYDTPAPVSGGAMTMDQLMVFNGAPNRYDFKLAGKKEIYMQYNDFGKVDYKKCPFDVYFKKGFPNPDCVRWELHRAWMVEATIKPGFRHILPKRTLYFDEDTWSAASGTSYDASGNVYRVEDAPYFPHYQYGYGNSVASGQFYDLQTGIWGDTAWGGFAGGGESENKPLPATFYSPEAMAGEGIR